MCPGKAKAPRSRRPRGPALFNGAGDRGMSHRPQPLEPEDSEGPAEADGPSDELNRSGRSVNGRHPRHSNLRSRNSSDPPHRRCPIGFVIIRGNRSGFPRCPHPTSIRFPGPRSRSRRTVCRHLLPRTSSPSHLSVSRVRFGSAPEPRLEGPSPRLRDRLVDLDGLVLVAPRRACKGFADPILIPS